MRLEVMPKPMALVSRNVLLYAGLYETNKESVISAYSWPQVTRRIASKYKLKAGGVARGPHSTVTSSSNVHPPNESDVLV